MEFLLDCANPNQIGECCDIFPVSGVTCNPTILKAEGRVDFFEHMREIRRIIGDTRSLHIQVLAKDSNTMEREAEAILSRVDTRVFIKIPVTGEGLKAIRRLKSRGVNITATAVYSKIQTFMAIEAGASYIAPYWNRIESLDGDPAELVSSAAGIIRYNNSGSKLLSASFRNIAQVNRALESGSHAVTVQPELLRRAFELSPLKQALEDFNADWAGLYGTVSLVDLAQRDLKS